MVGAAVLETRARKPSTEVTGYRHRLESAYGDGTMTWESPGIVSLQVRGATGDTGALQIM